MNKSIDINSCISREILCECGHSHYSSVKRIEIGENAIERLPSLIRDLGYHRVFMIADRNTMKAAGERAAEVLSSAGISFSSVILSGDEPVPNEQAIGEMITAYPMETDLILGVGSGTINDLCKFLSHRMQVDYIILATAPSMDGFVSTGAALMLRHVKTTIDCQGPTAVIGDTKILSEAPMRLIAAGLGDTLGKYTCLLDWKISRMINDEYYCNVAVDMVRTSLETVIRQAEGISRRDPDAVSSEMEALVLTGVAMSFVGNSRPASGCEHHFSHYWEMKALLEGRTPAHHGEHVAVGTVLALKLYHDLAEELPDFEKAKMKPFDPEAWKTAIRDKYGAAADGIICLEEKAQKNNVEMRNLRIDRIREQWPLIQEAIRNDLPGSTEITGILSSISAPVTPDAIGVSLDEVHNAVLYAKEVRSRYTLLQLLWDLGLSEKYADSAVEFFRKIMSE